MKKLLIAATLAMATMASAASATIINVSHHAWYLADVVIYDAHGDYVERNYWPLGQSFSLETNNNWTMILTIDNEEVAVETGISDKDVINIEIHGTTLNPSIRVD